MFEDKQTKPKAFIPSTILLAFLMLLGVLTILFGQDRTWIIVGVTIIAISVVVGIFLIVIRNSRDSMNM